MKRTPITLGAAIVLLLQVSAMAAISPVLIKLESDSTNYLVTYTVPSDKTLVVDAIQFYVNSGIELVSTNGVVFKMARTLKTGDSSASVSYTDGLYSLSRSIRIPPETVLRASLYIYGTNTACLYGALVDPDDLYARVPPNIQDLSIALAEDIAILAVSAGNDAIIRIEQCNNLYGDTWNTAATFATGNAPGRTIVLADKDSSRRFFRLRTLSR